MATVTADGVAYISTDELKQMIQTNDFTVSTGNDVGIIPRVVLLKDTNGFMYETLKECIDSVNVILTKAQIARIFLNATPL